MDQDFLSEAAVRMEQGLLSEAEFAEKYISPACKSLADKLKNGEPLTEIEYSIVQAAFPGLFD